MSEAPQPGPASPVAASAPQAAPPQPAAPQAAPPDTDGIWYASYPRGVPREISASQYASLTHFFDDCTARRCNASS
ncbi:hypothetical protein FHX59_002723 [Paraburkholderia silvatlantica]|uniref:Uncharacterized protein n=1 Tax=Paraburkholderia silvatlantica TaxID=321895 RepID=A0A2U1AE04_9BURK|nr:hypothetical protein [Paraburkholderia silvatlantica]PVY34652.1 hypothetical protein C7411_107192 [Paraburkholderia silvatlantica]PXW38867.1 hypothetical protein C7413_107192 [Paraburkholderia silvatlantica]PYE22467.1 hypothetical protein C7410_11089 [Paraburkholderia silvatlantica]